MHRESIMPITLEQAAEIARLLGPDWKALQTEDDTDTRRSLAYVGSDPDLKALTLTCSASTYGHYGKWHWSAYASYRCHLSLHEHIPYDRRGTYTSSINVAPTKPLPQIARDLQKRLLGSYMPVYRLAWQNYRASKARHAEAQTLAQDLAQMIGTTPRLNDGVNDEQIIYGHGDPYLHLRVSASGRAVYVERLSLNPAQARQLCQLVATWQPRA